MGFYLHGGILMKAGETGPVGLDIRYVAGTKIDFPSFVETDVDGVTVSLIIGWGYLPRDRSASGDRGGTPVLPLMFGATRAENTSGTSRCGPRKAAQNRRGAVAGRTCCLLSR